MFLKLTILLTKITATQNEAALSYHIVLGLYFLAVVFAAVTLYLLQFTSYYTPAFLRSVDFKKAAYFILLA